MRNQTSYLAILDVGHGNSAVLVDEDHVVVIDAGKKNGLIDYLKQQGITRIDTIILSHSDADHISGLIAILSSDEFDIREVRLNGDGRKDTKVWDYLAYELSVQNKKGTLKYEPSLTTNSSGDFNGPNSEIEILAPDSYLVTKGVGNTVTDGRRIQTNTMSAVIRIKINDKKVALLPGDIDALAVDYLLENQDDLEASTLVFPHHGGLAGTGVDMKVFTEKLCRVVQPRQIIFSIDRSSKLQKIVIDTAKSYDRNVRIACTQLSTLCASEIPSKKATHLTDAFAAGREKKRCCGGTFLVYFSQSVQVLPEQKNHLAFISENAPQALCKNDDLA